MVHVHKLIKQFRVGFLVFVLVGVISLITPGCKSPESPDSGGSVTVATVTVTNEYGEALDIYLDGIFQFVLAHEEDNEIEDISLDAHRLEAKKVGIDQVVDWYDFEITAAGDYFWIVDDPSDINVVNSSGVTLKIYMNEQYQFDLADEENRWILDVSRGEYLMRADKAEDGSEYASNTIVVTQNKNYTWEIN